MAFCASSTSSGGTGAAAHCCALKRGARGARNAARAAHSAVRVGRGSARAAAENADAPEVDESLAGQPIKYEKDMARDAFGRDPREETRQWMDAAKEVLSSDEVVSAQADFKASDSKLTREQQQYLDFVAKLDKTE